MRHQTPIARRLRPEEADLHRTIRLKALAESPRSFGQRHAEVAQLPRPYWEKLTRSVAEPARQTMLLADIDDAIGGSAYGLLDRQRSDIGRVGGMWVDPAYRRRGIATAFLDALRQWAVAQDFCALELWAPAHEAGAIALYQRCGFAATGERRPFAAATSELIAMKLELK